MTEVEAVTRVHVIAAVVTIPMMIVMKIVMKVTLNSGIDPSSRCPFLIGAIGASSWASASVLTGKGDFGGSLHRSSGLSPGAVRLGEDEDHRELVAFLGEFSKCNAIYRSRQFCMQNLCV